MRNARIVSLIASLFVLGAFYTSCAAQGRHHPTLTITNTSVAPAQVGQPYSAQFNVVGGTAPYTWTVVQGVLPAGLTLSTSGLLSGTPTASGTYNFTLKVTDSTGASARAIGKVLI